MKISKSNYFLTIVTTSLVLFFLGLFLMFFLQGRNFVDKLKEQANIVIELDNDLSASQKDSIETILNAENAILPGSVIYVSKEEALNSMKESLDLQYVESENPLNDMLQFNLKSEFIEEGSLANFNEAWSSMNGVKAVVYQIEFYEDVSTTLRSFSIVMFFIMIFFLIIAIILIHNTFYFRLNLDRVKIKTMELVGADWKFIKRPYIKESIKVAFYSWLISLALLLIIYVMFLISFPGSSDFFSMGLSIIVLIILGLVSYLICRQSASTLINRYLKQHMHNIY